LQKDTIDRTSAEAVDLLVKAKAKKPEETSLSLKLFELYAETNQKDKALRK
jgi:hypothetical protein